MQMAEPHRDAESDAFAVEARRVIRSPEGHDGSAQLHLRRASSSSAWHALHAMEKAVCILCSVSAV